jgi:AAA+ superfamily predicted ATPase
MLKVDCHNSSKVIWIGKLEPILLDRRSKRLRGHIAVVRNKIVHLCNLKAVPRIRDY